jgi:hypothetical protein
MYRYINEQLWGEVGEISPTVMALHHTIGRNPRIYFHLCYLYEETLQFTVK